jgi:hypothetical protein
MRIFASVSFCEDRKELHVGLSGLVRRQVETVESKRKLPIYCYSFNSSFSTLYF